MDDAQNARDTVVPDLAGGAIVPGNTDAAMQQVAHIEDIRAENEIPVNRGQLFECRNRFHMLAERKEVIIILDDDDDEDREVMKFLDKIDQGSLLSAMQSNGLKTAEDLRKLRRLPAALVDKFVAQVRAESDMSFLQGLVFRDALFKMKSY